VNTGSERVNTHSPFPANPRRRAAKHVMRAIIRKGQRPVADSKFNLAEIERLYRGTRLSIRKITEQTGASPAYISKLAKARGWTQGELANEAAAASQDKANAIEIIPPRPVPALLPADEIIDDLSERGKLVLAGQAAASGEAIAVAHKLFSMAAAHLARIEEAGAKMSQPQQLALASKAGELARLGNEILAKAAPVQLRAAGLPERVPHAAEAAAAAKALAGVNLTINNGPIVGLKPIAEMTDDELLLELQAS
jgi:hypothetical protein